jgi:hypothetical protein
MGAGAVTGATEREVKTIKGQYYNSPHFKKTGTAFEEAYCLVPIGKQPEEYDGPQRYCKNRAAKDGIRPQCRFHGAYMPYNPDSLPKYPNLKHSMYALPETILDTLTDEERDLLEWVMRWPEVYEIDLEADPASAHAFDTLALEIVRQARSSDYILANTEITTEGVYTPGGELLEQKTVPNRLIKDHQAQIRLIEKIKESLGITRKAQTAVEQTENRTDVMDSLSSALHDLINDDEAVYEPE